MDKLKITVHNPPSYTITIPKEGTDWEGLLKTAYEQGWEAAKRKSVDLAISWVGVEHTLVRDLDRMVSLRAGEEECDEAK